MKVAILGFDLEGRTSYEYFKAQGHEVTICDQNTETETPEGVATRLGPDYLADLGQFDLLVRTPGMHPAKILELNPDAADKITSATNEFFKACPTANIIGVTGTKGKGTTSTLITKILEAAGKKVHLGGNIGVPALSFINDVQPDDWVVLELSSFQLIDLHHSPHIAVCLMVVPEHLNWHADFAEYTEAKRQLFVHQTAGDLAVYNADNPTSRDLVSSSPARKLWYSIFVEELDFTEAENDQDGVYVKAGGLYVENTELFKVDEIALLGAHNWQNICAAIAATWEVIDHDKEAIHDVVTTFHGLEHRLELVRTVEGVSYYDDSFGTTPETAIVAMEAFSQPKVVILGGSDKGVDFLKLAVAVKNNNVRKALLIGDTAPKIQAALEFAGFTDFASGGEDMPAIVSAARTAAQEGDVVLLSTGCASFGMFQNYKDRAAKFQQAVNAL